jgi:hypothetical protein
MIQRIQSIYLLLTTALSFLFLKGSFLSFTDNAGLPIIFTFNGIEKRTGGTENELIQNVWPFTIVLVLVALLALITIFLYKKRTLQLLMTKILIGLISVLIIISVCYSYIIISKFGGTIIPGVKMALPLVLLVFSILAFRGIRKDDMLVKSYDRLR